MSFAAGSGNRLFIPLGYAGLMDMMSPREWTASDSHMASPVAAPAALQPGIVHFGSGRRFRAAVAPLIDRLRLFGHWDYGIVAVAQTDGPVFEELVESGGKYRLITRDGDKETVSTIESIISVLSANRDRQAVIASIADPRISVITVSVDPKEMGLTSAHQLDRSNPDIARELAGCDDPLSPIGQIVVGLAARQAAGTAGLTIFLCDNSPDSHLAFASAIDAMAVERDVALADWIAMNVRFPSVFGDRLVLDSGEGGLDSIRDVCAEQFIHWVIEDDLGSERAALGDIGVSLVRDVKPFLVVRERLLEGSLFLLANLGLLAGCSRFDEVMLQPAQVDLVHRFLSSTAALLPAVKGFDIARYTVDLKRRYANPALTLPLSHLTRLGSQRLPQRILPTIIEAMRRGEPADEAACAVAAWLVNCMAPENDDQYAEQFWAMADRAGDNWSAYVAMACDFEPVFGSIGKNPDFCALVTRSVSLIPGLESLVER